MKSKIWPSGHSDDYSTVFLFRSQRDAVKKRRPLRQSLSRLSNHTNGSPTGPYRLRNAVFVSYELDQDEEARTAQLRFEDELRSMGARIESLYAPDVSKGKQMWLHFTLPTSAELMLLNPEQLKLVQNVVEAAGGLEKAALGKPVRLDCYFADPPGGKQRGIWLGINWGSVSLSLIRSTFKRIRISTPVGNFPIEK